MCVVGNECRREPHSKLSILKGLNVRTSKSAPFTLDEPISFTLHSELGDKLAGVVERIERKVLYVKPV